jgi:DNA-binding IclR family transcriptional regulator
MARQIGIAALKSLDVVRFANTRLPQVRDELQQTAALAIWAYHSPTIIAVDEVRRPVMVSAHVGDRPCLWCLVPALSDTRAPYRG